MDRLRFSIDLLERGETESKENESRVLRNHLTSLVLDWEMAALKLDAERYKAESTAERESLRDSALVYRKCVSELTEIVAAALPFMSKAAH